MHGSRKPSSQILIPPRKQSSGKQSRKKSSTLFHATSTPSPTQGGAAPVSLESSGGQTQASASYKVVQRLLPDVSLARHIVDSDDHAFAFSECCQNHHHSQKYIIRLQEGSVYP